MVQSDIDYKVDPSIFLSIAFERIIVDADIPSSTVLINSKKETSIALCRLRAVGRWALIHSSLLRKQEDLKGLLKFIRFSPFDQREVCFISRRPYFRVLTFKIAAEIFFANHCIH